MFQAAKVEVSLVAMAVMDQTLGSKCLGGWRRLVFSGWMWIPRLEVWIHNYVDGRNPAPVDR